MKKCLKCEKEHDGSFGSGKYCSRACANSRSWSKEDKERKSNSAKSSNKVKQANKQPRKRYRQLLRKKAICPICNKGFEITKGKEKKYCSKTCYNTSRRSSRVKKTCPVCDKEFEVAKWREKNIYCSKECFSADTDYEYRPRPKTGGKRHGSGRGKKGWYKGYYCDSSWELAYVIYNLEHGVWFKRNEEGFEYSYEEKVKKFYPDFVLRDEVYVEVKGYKTKQVDAKLKFFPHKIIVLYENELKHVFNYVEGKYGKDYIKLYEKK